MENLTEILKKIENSDLHPGANLAAYELVQLTKSDSPLYQIVYDAFSLGFYRGVQKERKDHGKDNN